MHPTSAHLRLPIVVIDILFKPFFGIHDGLHILWRQIEVQVVAVFRVRA